MKFKVGDRVRAVTNDYAYTSKNNKWEGIVTKVHENVFSAETVNSINVDAVQKKYVYYGLKYDKFELVEPKKTKKERITELEKRLISLEERLAALEKQRHEETPQEQTQDVIEFEGKQYRKVNRKAQHGDVVVFKSVGSSVYFEINKPYKVQEGVFVTYKVQEGVFVNGVSKVSGSKQAFPVYTKEFNRTPETVEVYEPIQETQNVQSRTVHAEVKSPNQLRKEIIQKAKEFVEKHSVGRYIVGNDDAAVTFGDTDKLEFVVNKEKRTIVALIKGTFSNKVYHRGIAKCHPNDVFNEDIGKAIALGRALGLDVNEFENAVQPTEAVKGMIVKNKYEGTHEINAIKPTKRTYKAEKDFKFVNANKGYTFIDENDFEYWTRLDQIERIIDDTNAEY